MTGDLNPGGVDLNPGGVDLNPGGVVRWFWQRRTPGLAAFAVAALLGGCGRFGFDALGDGGNGDVRPDVAPSGSCFRGVAAGRMATCAIDARGDVWCWGHNGESEVDPANPFGYRLAPTRVVLPAPAVQLALGAQFACARLEDGQVACWGNNDSGELGAGPVGDGGPHMVQLGTERAVDLAAAAVDACIIRASDGGVMCWGSGADQFLTAASAVPIPVPGTSGMHGLVAAHRHACAIDAANDVWCWGRSRSGETGAPFTDHSTARKVPELGGAQQLALGGKYTCALQAGVVRCMGQGAAGELGQGTFTAAFQPVVPVAARAVEIRGGAHAVCARLDDGSSTCWGTGHDGILGDGRYRTRALAGATTAPALATFSVGYHHACGLTADQIVCWGRDTEGQLGRGSRAVGLTAQTWGAPASPQPFLAMGQQHACQVQNGAVSCWGNNTHGQVGNTSRTSERAAVTVTLPFTPVGVAAGGFTTCAWAATDTACWGAGESGEIGDGAFDNDPSPPTAIGLPGVVHMALGWNHVCALIGAQVRCWGSNSSGQLGAPNTMDLASPGVAVAGLGSPTRVAAGSGHTCVIDGSMVWCWGANFHGQLGDGTRTSHSMPTPVTIPAVPQELAVGSEHSCALATNGSVYCWGRNDGTEVGIMNPADQLAATRVDLPLQATAIAAGARGSCAVLSDGTVRCWGVGSLGELGSGGAPASSLPVAVSGVSTARLLARSYDAVCAGLTDGRVACWGNAEGGQLGSGLRDDVATPMAVPLSCNP